MSVSVSRSRTRWVVVAGLFAAVCGSSVAVAQSNIADTDLPSPRALASDGILLEEFLEEAGLGAAWRSATTIGARARGVRVDLDDSDGAALSALVVTIVQLVEAEDARARTTQLVLDAAIAIDRAIEREQNAIVARNIARHDLEVINTFLRLIAVDLFEIAYDGADEMIALDAATLNQAYRTREITESTVEEMIDRKIAAEEELARRQQALVDAIDNRREREDDHASLVERQSELTMTRAALDTSARTLIIAGAEHWVLAEIAGTSHLTPRALDAYLRAEQAMTLLDPGCRISWATIAAVSAVEGRHGTHANASLRFDGTSDPLIVGIALDGETEDNYGNPVANIADTDDGLYDGDTRLDRAVGPMQFIPQSWEQWKRDGDANDEENPHDLDDATVGAAAYLCSYGSHRSWEIWNTAVYGYNHSNSYVASVKGNLDRIARLRLPDVDDGEVWQPIRPAGAYVEPPPEPEPESEDEPPGEEAEVAAP